MSPLSTLNVSGGVASRVALSLLVNEIYASLLAQMVAQAMGAVVPLCLVAAWPLSAVQSHSSQSLTLITHPLQPDLSLFFNLRCLSFLFVCVCVCVCVCVN